MAWILKGDLAKRDSFSDNSSANKFIYWKEDKETKKIRFLYPITDNLVWCGVHYFRNMYYYCPAWYDICVERKPLREFGCPICRATEMYPGDRAAAMVAELSMDKGALLRLGIIMQAVRNFWSWFLAFEDSSGSVDDRNFAIIRQNVDASTTYSAIPEAPSAMPQEIPAALTEFLGLESSAISIDKVLEKVSETIDSRTKSFEELDRIVRDGGAIPAEPLVSFPSSGAGLFPAANQGDQGGVKLVGW